MNMETFKSEYLKEEDTVTVSAREFQAMLINYDELKRINKLLNKRNNELVVNAKYLSDSLEKCRNTHINLDLKV